MKLLCIHGIPGRELHEGRIYTQLATANCRCPSPRKPWPLVSVAETRGRVKACFCPRCFTTVPPFMYNGWYAGFRFVPIDPAKEDPKVVEELYKPKILEPVVLNNEITWIR